MLETTLYVIIITSTHLFFYFIITIYTTHLSSSFFFPLRYLYDYELYRKSKLQFRPAAAAAAAAAATTAENNNADDDLYIAEDITGDLYNTDYMGIDNHLSYS